MLNPEMLQTLGRLTAACTELAVTVVLGAVAGNWLDNHFSTSPVFLLGLSVTALIFGFVRLTRSLRDSDAAAAPAPPPDDPHSPDP